MAMKVRDEVTPRKIFLGIAALAIMVSMGMVVLQRTPNPAETVLVFIFGVFIPTVTSN